MGKHKHHVEADSVTVPEGGAPERVGKPGRPRGEAERVRGAEPGRVDRPAKGATRRPRGTSTARDTTGIDPQDPIDPESPNLR